MTAAFSLCEECDTIVVDLDAHRGQAHDWRLTAECPYCGVEFNPHKRDQTYCSYECATKDQQRNA